MPISCRNSELVRETKKVELPEEPKEVTFTIDDVKAWNADEPADKTKITHIDFYPQQTKGTYFIEFIEPVTE